MGDVTIEWDGANNRYYTYDVQMSDDGEEFTTVVNRSINTKVGSVTDTLRQNIGRYLRVNIHSCSRSGGYAAIYEIKLNGYMITSIYEMAVYGRKNEEEIIIKSARLNGTTLKYELAILEQNIFIC